MPNYSVSSPSGSIFQIDAPSEDHAKQLVQQRFFNGLEAPSEALQAPIDLSSFFSTEQHSLAKQIAAKRTGDPDATPTAADYFQAKDRLQPQNEAEKAADEGALRAKLRKQQREQKRLNLIWGDDDAPSSFLSEEGPPMQMLEDPRQMRQAQPWQPQQYAGPWSITNRLAAEAAMRRLRYHRTLAAISPRYSRSRTKGGL